VTEEDVRHFLDNWKVWMGVAYFGLAALVVWLFFLNQTVAKETAARAATQKAGAVSQRDNCYRQIDNNPDLIAIINAVGQNSRNSILSAKAALKLEPTGPLVAVRLGTIARAQAAIAAAEKFQHQILKTTPTVRKCDELALRLGLAPREKEGK
jgi:hypothetical protein